MATKDDVETLRIEMREGFANIQVELKDIRQRLDALESDVKNISGFAKEIDHLLQRVGAIEKHLGIHHNIAA
jgi:predicted  nucleic acid-binding Zn-ribbon protein